MEGREGPHTLVVGMEAAVDSHAEEDPGGVVRMRRMALTLLDVVFVGINELLTTRTRWGTLVRHYIFT